ncbi:1848_t:CDS:1 [Ambispora gerdemannii]|uniref:1848_t:CDS:1 n=1 Tax=Ambispora gerdemannii TaxID=144530 RepID=A0A9N8VLD7_9GLOM|nr:1848_t:CDS:1 [Ambispora gerdemannii]
MLSFQARKLQSSLLKINNIIRGRKITSSFPPPKTFLHASQYSSRTLISKRTTTITDKHPLSQITLRYFVTDNNDNNKTSGKPIDIKQDDDDFDDSRNKPFYRWVPAKPHLLVDEFFDKPLIPKPKPIVSIYKSKKSKSSNNNDDNAIQRTMAEREGSKMFEFLLKEKPLRRNFRNPDEQLEKTNMESFTPSESLFTSPSPSRSSEKTQREEEIDYIDKLGGYVSTNPQPLPVIRFPISSSSPKSPATDSPSLLSDIHPLSLPTQDTIISTSTQSLTPLSITIPRKSDPVITHVINMIMRDGKKERAKKLLLMAFRQIRLQTNNNPVQIIKDAIEIAAPRVRVFNKKKGSKVTPVPTPLNERQRHHRAIKWILEASDNRPEKDFGVRFGMEILAVINGVSKVLERKAQVHKMAVANRANLPIKW